MQPLQQPLCSMKYLDKEPGIEPKILYSDNHLCVVVKPPGMVVPIENNHVKSLEGFLKEYFQKELQKDVIFLRPIHRLDKPVGGIVIFARSSKALKRLQEAQRNKEIKKFYIAKVHGKVKEKRALLSDKLIHGDHRAEVDEIHGKEAKLYYRVIKVYSDESLLTIRLITGRYHQIRAQLSNIGHPIIGDHKYGSQSKKLEKFIALYHTKISLPHPVTKKEMVFTVRPDCKSLSY